MDFLFGRGPDRNIFPGRGKNYKMESRRDSATPGTSAAASEYDVETNISMTRRKATRATKSEAPTSIPERLGALMLPGVLIACGARPTDIRPSAAVLDTLMREYIAFARMNPFTEEVLEKMLATEKNAMTRASVARGWLRVWTLSQDFTTDRIGLRRAVEEVASGFGIAAAAHLGITVRPGTILTYEDARALVIAELNTETRGTLTVAVVERLADKLMGPGEVYRPASIDAGADLASPLEVLPPPVHDYACYRRYILGWTIPPPGPPQIPKVPSKEIVDYCVLISKGRAAQFHIGFKVDAQPPGPIKRSGPVAVAGPKLKDHVRALLAVDK